MKKLSLAIIALVVIALPVSAQWNTQIYVTGGTNHVQASLTNTTYVANAGIGSMTIPISDTVPVQISFKLAGAGTSAAVFFFDESLDNSVWKTSAFSISVTANGTNTVNNTGRFTLNKVPFLRLNTIANPNAEAITNLVVKWIQASQPGR